MKLSMNLCSGARLCHRPAAARPSFSGCCGRCPLAPHTAALRVPVGSLAQYMRHMSKGGLP